MSFSARYQFTSNFEKYDMNPIENLKTIFNQLNKDSLHLLQEIYSTEIIFEDPLKKINGLASVTAYFHELYSNLTYCNFIFHNTNISNNVAFLEWEMHLSHPRLNKGKEIVVPGISKVVFDEKVTYHRDYFDLGQMLYQNLPCIGPMVRLIKRKLGK